MGDVDHPPITNLGATFLTRKYLAIPTLERCTMPEFGGRHGKCTCARGWPKQSAVSPVLHLQGDTYADRWNVYMAGLPPIYLGSHRTSKSKREFDDSQWTAAERRTRLIFCCRGRRR